MSMRYEIYKLKYGEDGAKARIAEEARQDAIENANFRRETRKRDLNELEAEQIAKQAAPAANLEAVPVYNARRLVCSSPRHC